MRGLGQTQLEVLESLVLHKDWQNSHLEGWLWDTPSGTVKLMESLVRRGLASKDAQGVYRPTDEARSLIEQRRAQRALAHP